LLCWLYISLSVPRHRKMGWPGAQPHLRTTAAMAMVKRPAANRRPVAPPARSPKKWEASGNAPQTVAAALEQRDFAHGMGPLRRKPFACILGAGRGAAKWDSGRRGFLSAALAAAVNGVAFSGWAPSFLVRIRISGPLACGGRSPLFTKT